MKAAIYARVSSERQDVDLSISAQRRALYEYASRNDYQVVSEFIDEAESGTTAARPEFRRMIAMARHDKRPFDAVLVWKYSRFARSREDSIIFKAMLRRIGMQVISITEPVDNSATGKLMEAIIECMDEFYSANLGEEITRGMRESASRGFYVASHTPYGFARIKANDGSKQRPKLDADPNKATVVKRAFEDTYGGSGLTETVKTFNREGIAGPGGKGWSKTSLYKILTNEIYTGVQIWGKKSKRDLKPIRIENACPAIVSAEVFAKVQALLKSRSFKNIHPQRVASNYLLSGLIKCGLCGKAMVGQDAKSGKFKYYVCGTLLKKGSGSCESHYINSRNFEKLVIDKIRENILTERNLTELVHMVNEEMDAAASGYREQLDTILAEITDVDHRLDRLYDAIETGKLTLDDLSPRIKQLKTRREQLEAKQWELEWQLKSRKVELSDIKTVTNYVNELRDLLNESTIAERKSFIKSFVKEVVVTGDQVKMEYTIPMGDKGFSQESLAVPHIVHHGGANITFPHPISCSCSPLLSVSMLSPQDILADLRSSEG